MRPTRARYTSNLSKNSQQKRISPTGRLCFRCGLITYGFSLPTVKNFTASSDAKNASTNWVRHNPASSVNSANAGLSERGRDDTAGWRPRASNFKGFYNPSSSPRHALTVALQNEPEQPSDRPFESFGIDVVQVRLDGPARICRRPHSIRLAPEGHFNNNVSSRAFKACTWRRGHWKGTAQHLYDN